MKVFGFVVVMLLKIRVFAFVIGMLLATPSQANLFAGVYEDPMRVDTLETASGQYNAGLSSMRTMNDFETAVKWFRKAAFQGHAISQAVLGSLYATGSGVPQDLVNAHAWVSLALPNLHGRMLHRTEALQDELESLMAPKELKEAQALTNSWFTIFPSMDR